MKKTSVIGLMTQVPDEVYLAAANRAMGSNFQNLDSLMAEVPEITSEYLAGSSFSLKSLIAREALSRGGSKDIFREILSKDLARDLCFLVLGELDRSVHEIYATSLSDNPNKWGFSFVLAQDRPKPPIGAYGISTKRSKDYDPDRFVKKTFFDKEIFLRTLKDGLWNHFDAAYSLSVEPTV